MDIRNDNNAKPIAKAISHAHTHVRMFLGPFWSPERFASIWIIEDDISIGITDLQENDLSYAWWWFLARVEAKSASYLTYVRDFGSFWNGAQDISFGITVHCQKMIYRMHVDHSWLVLNPRTRQVHWHHCFARKGPILCTTMILGPIRRREQETYPLASLYCLKITYPCMAMILGAFDLT